MTLKLLKSLKKYKVPILILVVFILVSYLIITFIKRKNKESFGMVGTVAGQGGIDISNLIKENMKDGKEGDSSLLRGLYGISASDKDTVIQELENHPNINGFISLDNMDNTMDVVAYTELPSNFDDVCKENGSGSIIEYSSEQFITDLDTFKTNLLGVWAGSVASQDLQGTGKKMYIDFNENNGVYNIIFTRVADSSVDVIEEIIQFNLTIEKDSPPTAQNYFVTQQEPSELDFNITKISMVRGMLRGNTIYLEVTDKKEEDTKKEDTKEEDTKWGKFSKCVDNECPDTRALIDFNNFLKLNKFTDSTDSTESMTFQLKDNGKINNGEIMIKGILQNYEINFYYDGQGDKYYNNKFVLNVGEPTNEYYVIHKNKGKTGIVTQTRNGDSTLGEPRTWNIDVAEVGASKLQGDFSVNP